MTNVISIDPRPSPADAAASWIARIDAGPLSTADRELLNAWLAEDPVHGRLLDDHARAWALSSAAREQSSEVPVNPSRRYALGAAVAASAAALIGVGLFRGPDDFEGTYSTGIGESRKVSLPDGSRVILNTASKLTVRYTGGQRKLRLVMGEAMFDVAHNADRPFEVAAAGTITRAVGTRFSVRTLSPTRVAVVVTEGRVELRDQPDTAAESSPGFTRTPVAAGERALADATTAAVARLETSQLERETSWTAGGIAFRSERLVDVLAEVNRYSAGPIRLGDPELGDMRVSGYFAIGNVRGFLSGLSAGAGLSMTTAPNRTTVLSRN